MLGGRGDRNDRFATLRARRSANEVHLPANPAVELVSDGVRANLASQVDLQSRINGHHVVVTGNERGIVGIGGGMKLENRIVVDEVEQLLRPQRETENRSEERRVG